MTAPRWTVIVVALFSATNTPADTGLDELTEAVRSMIESNLEASAGVGFQTFECEASLPLKPDQLFDCEAVDDEGDILRYVIAVDGDGTAEVVLASQPAGQLDAGFRDLMDAPCRAFLTDSEAGRWTELYGSLHPLLQEQITADGLRAQLESAWDVLGQLRSAALVTHAVHVSGRHELVYALDCANGPGVARFGIAEDDVGATRVTAFTLSAAPGTPLQAVMLADAGRDMLSDVVGAQIVQLEAPLDRLVRPGDAVEGVVTFADGNEMPFRTEQTGRKDDFDPVDYRFQVLDAPWLVERMFAQRSQEATSVNCPARVVPDGGEQTCTVDLMSGERLSVTIARRGGEHRVTRMTSVDPSSP